MSHCSTNCSSPSRPVTLASRPPALTSTQQVAIIKLQPRVGLPRNLRSRQALHPGLKVMHNLHGWQGAYEGREPVRAQSTRSARDAAALQGAKADLRACLVAEQEIPEGLPGQGADRGRSAIQRLAACLGGLDGEALAPGRCLGAGYDVLAAVQGRTAVAFGATAEMAKSGRSLMSPS